MKYLKMGFVTFQKQAAGLFLITLSAVNFGCETQSKTELIEIPEHTPLVGKVYPLLDTENSRWFYFASASRPFGMVNLSPDTQIDGAWGSGYRYATDTIKGFSHVHGWQTSGLSVMPVQIEDANHKTVFTDFYAPFSHDDEIVFPGYHRIILKRSGITAELSSTTRVGMHRYTFSNRGKPAMLFNLNTMLGPSGNQNGIVTLRDSVTLEGALDMMPTHRRPKPFRLYFQIKSNAPIDSIVRDEETKNYLVFTKPKHKRVLLKVAISYTSVANAALNGQQELPHWDFTALVQESAMHWEQMLGRIRVDGGTPTEQRRFYTDLWHALQGRRIISDVNGAYPDNTGELFRIGQIPLNQAKQPLFNHYNSDSFWGAQWTLNTLWGLVYPDIMKEFSESLMLYYQDGGLVPRGPSGGNYTYVMTGASSTPFLVSAIQKGIARNNLDSIYDALKKNHMPGGIMAKAGYEHQTNLGGGLEYYIKNGFVPYPITEGKFGSHQDGASLTLEYAYQDWVLAQLAKKLGKAEDHDYFMQRSENYRNVFDSDTGYMRPKDIKGNWQHDFDPLRYENGFNEGNSAQATWFVPHNIDGLATLMGGTSRAVERLNQQFEIAEAQGFTSGTSHEVEQHPEFSRIPINYGNQPSIQTGFIFNHLGRPDLTQYWTRKIIDKVFNGISPKTGYNGDEDQGLMGSLAVLLKIGLFQMNGGTEANPEYDLGSPIFDRIEIDLDSKFYAGKTLIIKSYRKNREAWKVSEIKFNGKPHSDFKVTHNQITGGGTLELFLED
jgi:predicted alpha-1,2-mannosidase